MPHSIKFLALVPRSVWVMFNYVFWKMLLLTIMNSITSDGWLLHLGKEGCLVVLITVHDTKIGLLLLICILRGLVGCYWWLKSYLLWLVDRLVNGRLLRWHEWTVSHSLLVVDSSLGLLESILDLLLLIDRLTDLLLATLNICGFFSSKSVWVSLLLRDGRLNLDFPKILLLRLNIIVGELPIFVGVGDVVLSAFYARLTMM
jgi:hypothetical protein